MEMEVQGGDAAELLVWEPGTGSSSSKDAGAAAACLCPAALAAAAAPVSFPAASLFPRHALEQEVLRRADVQLQQGGASGGGGGDRRRERRMKNRASAARSRERRFAYLNELEKEVSLLRAENDDLRKLCQELKAAAAEAPAKRAPRRLQRTSSAPF
ncbi:unnamed protein product [Urochloa decumbens]|uniref:BZIP domain-containing protein n=1 Tax=Urochloa decumbens TaxID=240449 RepID=A0ABC9BEP4_9POAL